MRSIKTGRNKKLSTRNSRLGFGGALVTVKYAQGQGKPVVNLAEKNEDHPFDMISAKWAWQLVLHISFLNIVVKGFSFDNVVDFGHKENGIEAGNSIYAV